MCLDADIVIKVLVYTKQKTTVEKTVFVSIVLKTEQSIY